MHSAMRIAARLSRTIAASAARGDGCGASSKSGTGHHESQCIEAERDTTHPGQSRSEERAGCYQHKFVDNKTTSRRGEYGVRHGWHEWTRSSGLNLWESVKSVSQPEGRLPETGRFFFPP